MTIVYIGLGSNLGNRRENLLLAWARLGAVPGVKLLALSSPYCSEPVNMQSTNWFINA
ncbi:MAG: 2-amino-4-hydroxy-6-hydroxymethyldihydropteridine diphosphokinase, partial [Desulfobulbales bacterium]